MKEIDYIIVGGGLAGISLAELLFQNNKSFVLYDDCSQQSSIVAAGLYNPVILKRFTPVWKANEQLNLALPFYNQIEKRLNIKVDYKLDLFRRFASIEEQNLWFTASDKPILSKYLSDEIRQNKNKCINATFGLGKVNEVGRLDIELLVKSYKEWLEKINSIEKKTFEYNKLKIEKTSIHYIDTKATRIIFAEGFGMKKNPFFNDLPLNGTKGEVLTVKIPELKMDYGIKSSVFLIPIGDDLYKVGATYEWNDKTNKPSEKGKNELIKKLKTFFKCEFEIIEHKAGVRPTVVDRRPLVGQHSTIKNMYVCNGLGTRGVMNAPYAANQLYDFIERKTQLDTEIDIKRFKEK